jgi:hypothetical protein
VEKIGEMTEREGEMRRELGKLKENNNKVR